MTLLRCFPLACLALLGAVAPAATINVQGPARFGAGGGGDVTPPAFSSASIATNGTTLTVVWTENVTRGAGYNDADLNVDASAAGSNLSLTYVSGDGTSTFTYTIGTTVTIGETADLDFNGDANSLEDGSGNDMAALTSSTIANLSESGAEFTDDFNRANGGPGSNWDVDGGATAILSNQLTLSGTGLYNLIRLTTGAATIGNNQGARVDIISVSPTAGGLKEVHLAIRRASDNSGGYSVAANGSTFDIFDNDGGVLASGSLTFGGSDWLELRGIGTTISLWKNGVQVTSFTDATYSSGQPGVGFYVDNSGVTGPPIADNFRAITYP